MVPGQRLLHRSHRGAFASPNSGIYDNPQCGYVGQRVTEAMRWVPAGIACTQDHNVAASQQGLSVRIEEQEPFLGPADLFRRIEGRRWYTVSSGRCGVRHAAEQESKDLDVERRGIALGDLIHAVVGDEPEVMRQGNVVGPTTI